MQQHDSLHAKRWFSWMGVSVLATTVGVFVVASVLERLIANMAWSSGVSPFFVDTFSTVLLYTVVGICLSVAQWYVVSPHVTMPAWVCVTTFGCVVGSILFSIVIYPLAIHFGWYSDQLSFHRWFWMTGALTMCSVLFVVGCGQAVALQRVGLSSKRWFIASSVGAGIAGLFVGLTFLDANTDAIDWAFAWLIGSFCWSLCTGFVLPRSLRGSYAVV